MLPSCRPVSGSDGAGEFGGGTLDASVGARVDAEFVAAAPDVLEKRVTANDDPRRMVEFESTHRTKRRFEATVVAFDAVIRVLLRVVKR